MKEFTLPLEPPAAGETVTFKVEWGDGTSEVFSYSNATYNVANLKHQYIDANGNDLPANEFEIKIYPLAGEKFGKYWRYIGNESYAADSTKLKEIKKWGCFEFAPTGYAFNGCSNLNISATDTTHEQPVIPAGGLNSAFKNCSSLNPASISADAGSYFNDLNTGLVTSLAYTFQGCTNFDTDISGWDVSGVSQMSSTFQGASSFNQDISIWSVDNATTMSAMFKNADSFDQPIGGWDTADVTSMFQMFSDAGSFNRDLSGWITSNVTTMQSMFENAAAFNQGIGTWDTSSVDSMNYIFKNATDFNQDLSNWSITNVSTASDMFDGSGQSGANAEATNTSWQTQDSSSPAAQESQSTDVFTPADRAELKTAVDAWVADEASTTATYGDINTWNTSNITDMHQLFQQKQAFNSVISNWDVSNVTNMSQMFSGAYAFNRDISSWDVSSVTNMEYMFNYTYAFNQNLNLWDTSSVTNMKGTFDNAFVFNGNIGTWDTSNVTTMDSIFRDQNSTGSFNQDISMKSVTQNGRTYDAWDTGNVTNMNHAFYGQASFDQPIGNWDTSKVTNMSFMFGSAYAFNQPLNSWDVISVTSMNGMFYDATAFDQPLSNWSTDNVSIFEKVFRGATNFNQPIGQWNTDSATSMEQMFEKATNFNQDIGSWNTSSVTKMDSMFKEASAFNQDLSGWDITSINSASNMFLGSGQSGANAEATNTSWQTQDSSSPASQESEESTIESYIELNYQATDSVAIRFAENLGGITIDWGDGTSASATNGVNSHTYSSSGPQTVTITGNVTKIGTGYIGDIVNSNANLTSAKISGMASITDPSYMFHGASNLTSVDLTDWDTSNVTQMLQMFLGASSLSTIDTTGWDTSKVASVNGLFQQCTALTSVIGMENWSTDSLADMNTMFYYTGITSLDLSLWNPSSDATKVHQLRYAFGMNSSLSTVGNLENWDTSEVTNMDAMFANTAITSVEGIGNWDIRNLQTADSFVGVTLSTTNYDALLNGWSTLSGGESQIPSNVAFHGGNSKYSTAGDNARNTLINTYGWTITDGGQAPEAQVTLMMAGSILMKGWANFGSSNPSSNMEMIGWEDEAEICAGVGGASTTVFTADGNVEAGDLLYVTNIDYGASIGDSVTQSESAWKEIRSAFPENTATTTVNGVAGGWVLRFYDHSIAETGTYDASIYKALSLASHADDHAIGNHADSYTVISVGDDCSSAATSQMRVMQVVSPTIDGVPMGDIQLTINGAIQQPFSENTIANAGADNKLKYYSIEPGTVVGVEAIPAAGKNFIYSYIVGGTFSDGQTAITQASSSFTMPDFSSLAMIGAGYS